MRTVEEIKANIAAVTTEVGPRACSQESMETWREWKLTGLKAELFDAMTTNITLDRLREICDAERSKQNEEFVVEATGSEAKHIIDLLKAETDGRCVVLPCKVGDTVREPYDNGLIDESKVQRVCIEIETDTGVFGASDFGKTVFLTRSEAEAALQTITDPRD